MSRSLPQNRHPESWILWLFLRLRPVDDRLNFECVFPPPKRKRSQVGFERGHKPGNGRIWKGPPHSTWVKLWWGFSWPKGIVVTFVGLVTPLPLGLFMTPWPLIPRNRPHRPRHLFTPSLDHSWSIPFHFLGIFSRIHYTSIETLSTNPWRIPLEPLGKW